MAGEAVSLGNGDIPNIKKTFFTFDISSGVLSSSAMSDRVIRGLSVQLNTTMDSILKKASVELMQIFKNAVCDYQREIAQKGEEIVQLKLKLQAAELKLKEVNASTNKTVKTPPPKSEVVPATPEATPAVSEMQFGEPDDWCAPLNDETETKQDEGFCPSVRLRPFSIPLRHIPIKQEVGVLPIDCQTVGGSRRSRRISGLNKKPPFSSKRSSSKSVNQLIKRNIRVFLTDILNESKDNKGLCNFKGQKNGTLDKGKAGQAQSNEQKSSNEEQKSVELESTTNSSPENYPCALCGSVFSSDFGRGIHIRAQKKCNGCKMAFCFRGGLLYHKKTCAKLKEGQKNPTESLKETCDETPVSPGGSQVVQKTENMESSGQGGDAAPQSLQCNSCDMRFENKTVWRQHRLLHSDIVCAVCGKKFLTKKKRKRHMLKQHEEPTPSATGELTLMKPVENLDKEKCTMSPKKPPIGSEFTKNWQLFGSQTSSGFSCNECEKVLATKYSLMSHVRIHTGEKPYRCEECQESFRFGSALFIHVKKIHSN